MSHKKSSFNQPGPVFVLVPDPDEFAWVAEVLQRTSIPFHRCLAAGDLQAMPPGNAGAVLVSDQLANENDEIAGLIVDILSSQEPWSDLPIFLINGNSDHDPRHPSLRTLKEKNKLTIFPRPLTADALTGALRVALRARQHQHKVQGLLEQSCRVLASINDSFVMVDRDWKFVYVNQKAADMHDIPADKLLGRVIWEVLPDLATDPFRVQLEEAALQQQELHTDCFHTNSQRWFQTRVYPSHDGISIFATDITERRHVEENLRFQLDITQAITDNAADSLFLLDPAGQVTFMNPAAEKTFGWKKEELMGKVLHDHVHYHRSRNAKLDCPLHSVFTFGLTLRDLEDQFHCKDGSRLNVSCSNAAIIIDGEPAGSVFVVHDITYHKLAEQQLKALNETLALRVAERAAIAEQRASQLSALASELTQTEQRERRRLAHILHDNLQQILVATKLQLNMLRARVKDENLRRDMLHIEELINRSVEESRNLTVELSPPILYDAGLGRALEWLARRMEQEHGLTVKLEADPAAEPEGDDIRAFLFQAVREALFNIVKHAGVYKASVSISLAKSGLSVVQIKDEGCGFESQPAGKAQENGGFGLFSLRERLEFLGGRMVITSAPGRGTCMALYVPIRHQKANAGDNTAKENRATGPGTIRSICATSRGQNTIRVLIADDHKILRDGLVGLLQEEADIQIVSEASDGEMALKMAHETTPHVVIMDVTMPRLNGVEATRRLTAELPHIKVIGLSMHEEEDMTSAMRDAGAVNYITKGAPSEILIAAIRDCMKLTPGGAPTPSSDSFDVVS